MPHQCAVSVVRGGEDSVGKYQSGTAAGKREVVTMAPATARGTGPAGLDLWTSRLRSDSARGNPNPHRFTYAVTGGRRPATDGAVLRAAAPTADAPSENLISGYGKQATQHTRKSIERTGRCEREKLAA